MKRAIRRISILFIMFLVITASALSQQCQATTKKGTQCKRNAQAGSIYCWQHTRMYGTGSTESTTTTKSNQTVQPSKSESENVQCQAITKKGTQCSRKAQAGSKLCWQHQGSTNTIDKNNSTNTNTNTKINSTPSSGSGTIYTGPRGGQYRISASGKKVYIRHK
jgi:hypothetical protein